MSDLCVHDGQTMLLIGDSITDCGRRSPEGAPLGNGYVAFLADLVLARSPGHGVRFVNKGIGGNTILDLAGRWADDVVAERPDWLSVMIGINDLHRTLNGVLDIPPEVYRQHYERLLAHAVEQAGPQLVLLEPFYMTTGAQADEAQGVVLRLLEPYIDVVHELAERFGARLCRTHAMFQRQLRHRPSATFCAEPVHPNRTGHLLIACELLATLGG